MVPFLNLVDSNYVWLRPALARVLAGAGRARFPWVGDSIMRGFGALGTNSGYTSMQPNSYPARVAQLLTAAGIPSGDNSVWGWGGIDTLAHLNASDPRLSVGANWGNAGNAGLPGAYFYYPSGGGTNPLTFTPPQSCDSVRYWYSSGSGNGSFTAKDGATTLGTIDTSVGGGVIAQTTYTGLANGAHTFSVVPTNAQLNILGIECWSSVTPRVEMLNLGFMGSKVAQKVSNVNGLDSYSCLAAIGSLVDPVDLWIDCVDTNDSSQGTALAAYQSSYASLVARQQATSGDVLMFGGPPQYSYEAARLPYTAAEMAVATAAGVAFVDQSALYPSYQAGNNRGMYTPLADGTHLSATGLAATARMLANVILGI